MTDDAVGTLGLIFIGMGVVAIANMIPMVGGIVLLAIGILLWIAGNR